MSHGIGRVGGEVDEQRDIVVVGAGPAGLFAALGILGTANDDVLIADAGRDIEQREHIRSRDLDGNLVMGVGGAGLFSDGKLCLSLGVGGELGAITTGPARERLLHEVASVFDVTHLLTGGPTEPSPFGAEVADLDVTSYPVFHVGTDHCTDHIRHVRDRVCSLGADLRTEWRLRTVRRSPDGFHLLFEQGDRSYAWVVAQRVVLALGKVGAKQEERLCRELGASATTVPMYLGVRLETDSANAHPLFRGGADPKLKLYFDDGSKMKTHCAAEGGEVLPLYYGGLPLAGGHANRTRTSGRTSFAVLWNGMRGLVDTFEAAKAVMRRSAALACGRLLAQRMVDLLEGRPSRLRDIRCCRPTTTDWSPGDLRQVLPQEFFDRFDSFVQLLYCIAPGLASESTVLFAPAIEWWTSRIVTDDKLQTEIPGLYVAGDGAGWSQGIVHAAASGLLAAEGITGEPKHSDAHVNCPSAYT